MAKSMEEILKTVKENNEEYIKKIETAEQNSTAMVSQAIAQKKSNPNLAFGENFFGTYDFSKLQEALENVLQEAKKDFDELLQGKSEDEKDALTTEFNNGTAQFESIIETVKKDKSVQEKVIKDLNEGKEVSTVGLFDEGAKKLRLDIENPDRNSEGDLKPEEDSISVEEEKKATEILGRIAQMSGDIRKLRDAEKIKKREQFFEKADAAYAGNAEDKLKQEYFDALEEHNAAKEQKIEEYDQALENAQNGRAEMQGKLMVAESKFDDYRKTNPAAINFEKENNSLIQKIEDAKKIEAESDDPKKVNQAKKDRLAAQRRQKQLKKDFEATPEGQTYKKMRGQIASYKAHVAKRTKQCEAIKSERDEFEKQSSEYISKLFEEYTNKLPEVQKKPNPIMKLIGAVRAKFAKGEKKESKLKALIDGIQGGSEQIKGTISKKWEKFTNLNESRILQAVERHLNSRLTSLQQQQENDPKKEQRTSQEGNR